MRTKYRKPRIYAVSLVIGIGMITFPITPGSDTEAEDYEANSSVKNSLSASLDSPDTAASTEIPLPSPTAELMTLTPAATPTPAASATPAPVYPPSVAPKDNPLLATVPEDVEALIEAYFDSLLSDSFDDYRELIYNQDAIDESIISKKVEYIKAYHNIDCYAKLGTGPVDYVIYALNDVEIATIDTYAPSLDQLFVCYDSDGLPRIYLPDSLTEEQMAYFTELRSAEDVAALIREVTGRMTEAITSDSSLREFIAKISLPEEDVSAGFE